MDVCKQDLLILKDSTLLRGVKEEHIEVYLQNSSLESYPAETILTSPDEVNRYLYLIISGQLRIHLNSLESEPLTILPKGDCAGEMSIIEDKEASAYVITHSDCRLSLIDYKALWALIDVSHEVARNLLYILSGRVRISNKYISDTVRMKKLYEHYSKLDFLTGVYNRRWLDNYLPHKIISTRIEQKKLFLIMLDIDHFKQYNDNNGHPAGDRALHTLAHVLKDKLRSNDTIVRYGGEEFLIILTDKSSDNIQIVAERLREAISEASIVNHEGQSLPTITISLGIAELQPGETMQQIISAADAALYRAKEKGRNCISL